MQGNINLLNKIQSDVLHCLIKHNFKGTIQLATGHGKNAVALKIMNYIHNNVLENPRVLILAETTLREANIRVDFDKLSGLYDQLSYKQFDFMCYQSAYKTILINYDLILFDEVHECMTPVYSRIFENINPKAYLIGLTATTQEKVDYETYTKKDLYIKHLPIIYRYTLSDAKEYGTARRLRLRVIELSLDNEEKNILSGNKNKPFYQTEKAKYDYLDRAFKISLFQENENLIKINSSRRAKFLYGFPSKIKAVSELLKELSNEKTIVFSNDLDSLSALVPTVSSKNKEEINDEIINNFQNGVINHIGSFKMLRQGQNLNGLKNVVLVSYYSNNELLEQIIGRLRKDGTEGYVYVFLTKDTQEEVWFNKLFKDNAVFH